VLKFLYIAVFLVFNSLFCLAQEPNEGLARQYMLNGEYAKAAAEYEKLYNSIPNNFYLDEWLNACLQLKEYDKAEKLIKKQIKQQAHNLALSVKLGMIYNAQNEAVKAKKEYNKAIDNLSANQEQIFGLYQAFLNQNELDYALTTLIKARKLMKGAYPFAIEMAEIYQQKNNYEAMFNEYLNLLDLGPGYLQQVESIIQSKLDEDSDSPKNQLLKTLILKRIQQSGDNSLLTEFFAWLLMQEKNFDGAFLQLKTLDKRNKEEGARLMTLAPVAANNDNIEVAIKCYEYVIAKGKDNFYYSQARMELVKALQKKIISQVYKLEDITQLEQQYLSVLAELGKNQTTFLFIKDLAHLYAFYLQQPQKAIDLLYESMDINGINERSKAEAKLELADILVFTGDVWESALLYGQVEKAFKEDPLGQEAKFRNARLSYYRGEFAWAQAQLDVLKASTSKLIANDALYLSLLIIENSGLDSNTTPLLLFSRAELLFFQNKTVECLATLDSIEKDFSAHPLADDILFKKAQIAMKQNQWETAEKYYKEVIEKYSDDLLADDALINLAKLYENQLNNKMQAQLYYQKLLTDYSGSIYAAEARKAYRRLRGDKLN